MFVRLTFLPFFSSLGMIVVSRTFAHDGDRGPSTICTAVGRMCGLSTVVTPAGASLTMYREIRSYANRIWDDNNNNNILVFILVCHVFMSSLLNQPPAQHHLSRVRSIPLRDRPLHQWGTRRKRPRSLIIHNLSAIFEDAVRNVEPLIQETIMYHFCCWLNVGSSNVVYKNVLFFRT